MVFKTPACALKSQTPPDLQVQRKTVIVDLGYRGVDRDNPEVRIIHRGKIQGLSQTEQRWLKRRQAIEPVITSKKITACGTTDSKARWETHINAVLAAASFNIPWLQRAIARLGLKALWQLLCALIKPALQARWHSSAPPSFASAHTNAMRWVCA